MKNILVIGAGLIGARHVQHVIAHEFCHLAGIVEPNREIAAEFDAPVFSSIEDVNVPVDGAIIATPTGLHCEHGKQCAVRGWHILIEKPIAETLDEANALVEATKNAGVKTLVGHHRRYHKKIGVLKNLLASGEIGQPVTATAHLGGQKAGCLF